MNMQQPFLVPWVNFAGMPTAAALAAAAQHSQQQQQHQQHQHQVLNAHQHMNPANYQVTNLILLFNFS